MVVARHPQGHRAHASPLLSSSDGGLVSTAIRLRRPDELLAAVPYLLGFHPSDSLVLILTRAGRLHLVCRHDLPMTQPEAARLAADVAQLSARDRADPAIIVAYEGLAGRADRARHTVRSLWADRPEAPVEFVVRDRRWWLAAPDGHLDGPGHPEPDSEALPALAEWVAAGISPLTGREALQQALEPTALAASVAAELISCRAAGNLTWPARLAAWSAVLDLDQHRHPLHRDEVALAATALDEVAWRDAVIGWLVPDSRPARTAAIDRLLQASWGPAPWGGGAAPEVPHRPSARAGRPGPADADRGARLFLARHCLDRLTLFGRSLPTGEQAPALTVLAAFAWSLGDGARAGVALDRALWIEPSDTLAALLQRLVQLGIRLGRN